MESGGLSRSARATATVTGVVSSLTLSVCTAGFKPRLGVTYGHGLIMPLRAPGFLQHTEELSKSPDYADGVACPLSI